MAAEQTSKDPPGGVDAAGVERWVPLLYDELRRIARRERVRLFTGGTLATTALVNEAYARLAGDTRFGSRGAHQSAGRAPARQRADQRGQRRHALRAAVRCHRVPAGQPDGAVRRRHRRRDPGGRPR